MELHVTFFFLISFTGFQKVQRKYSVKQPLKNCLNCQIICLPYEFL